MCISRAAQGAANAKVLSACRQVLIENANVLSRREMCYLGVGCAIGGSIAVPIINFLDYPIIKCYNEKAKYSHN